MGNQPFRDRRRAPAERSSFLRELYGPASRRQDKPEHKTAMLCRQVERALSLALGGECDDPFVARLRIVGAEPAPNAGHLVVRLAVPSDLGIDGVELIHRLGAATPRLRFLVGQSISRKRVPSLSFIPVPEGGGQ